MVMDDNRVDLWDVFILLCILLIPVLMCLGVIVLMLYLEIKGNV